MNYNEINYKGKIINRVSYDMLHDRLTVLSKNGKSIYVAFLCDKKKLESMGEVIGLRVDIGGHIETRQERTRNGMVYRQRCFVDSIVPLNTMIEEKFGVKGKFYDNFSATVYLTGEVMDIKREADWYRYAIRIDGENEVGRTPSLVWISQRELDRHPNVKAGNKICCICSFSTPKKEVKGKTNVFEDIIVMDLAVME